MQKFGEAYYAPVAQWIRALVSGTKGHGFESLQAYHPVYACSCALAGQYLNYEKTNTQ